MSDRKPACDCRETETGGLVSWSAQAPEGGQINSLSPLTQQVMTVTPKNPGGTPVHIRFDGLNRPTKIERENSGPAGTAKMGSTDQPDTVQIWRDRLGRVVRKSDSKKQGTIEMDYDEERLEK